MKAASTETAMFNIQHRVHVTYSLIACFEGKFSNTSTQPENGKDLLVKLAQLYHAKSPLVQNLHGLIGNSEPTEKKYGKMQLSIAEVGADLFGKMQLSITAEGANMTAWTNIFWPIWWSAPMLRILSQKLSLPNWWQMQRKACCKIESTFEGNNQWRRRQ